MKKKVVPMVSRGAQRNNHQVLLDIIPSQQDESSIYAGGIDGTTLLADDQISQ